jgi:hypothetical protein
MNILHNYGTSAHHFFTLITFWHHYRAQVIFNTETTVREKIVGGILIVCLNAFYATAFRISENISH